MSVYWVVTILRVLQIDRVGRAQLEYRTDLVPGYLERLVKASPRGRDNYL